MLEIGRVRWSLRKTDGEGVIGERSSSNEPDGLGRSCARLVNEEKIAVA